MHVLHVFLVLSSKGNFKIGNVLYKQNLSNKLNSMQHTNNKQKKK